MHAELPIITASMYVPSHTKDWHEAQQKAVNDTARRLNDQNNWQNAGVLGAHAQAHVADFARNAFQPKEPPMLRIVRVFIVDPNENLPLDKRVLYAGPETNTDLSDQDLFYELPIQDLLKKHNELRLCTLDKKATERQNRTVYLEPVRVSGLKMNVTVIASF